MKIKIAFSSVLFFSFLLVTTNYCFCQLSKESTKNTKKAQSTTKIPASVASAQKQSPIETPVKSDAAEKSEVNKETAIGNGDRGILKDVKRILDEHPQEFTSITTTSIALTQKQSPIENPVKSDVAEKPQVNKGTATGKGDPGILQDVKRVWDEHPQESTNNKIKSQSTPTSPTSIASAQKQWPIENPVKSDAAKKSKVNQETANSKDEPGILQDVKRVSDAHP